MVPDKVRPRRRAILLSFLGDAAAGSWLYTSPVSAYKVYIADLKGTQLQGQSALCQRHTQHGNYTCMRMQV